jgi:uracil-DNA glycosylase family 4
MDAYRVDVRQSSPLPIDPTARPRRMAGPLAAIEPSPDCPLCPRLVALREDLRGEHPDWWNAPVPAFGDDRAWLGLIGLAPGKHGANRTGRPFTGDFAGDLLFATLAKFGFARGEYRGRPDDGLTLDGVIILNSVKCLPPQNKPEPPEIAHCAAFLAAQRAALPGLHILIALGQIAHRATVKDAGGRQSDYRFGHGAEHVLPDGTRLIDSYHCSRYNQNTGRLTETMFEAVFARALELRDYPRASSISGVNSSTSAA